jgi:hypothetical protein
VINGPISLSVPGPPHDTFISFTDALTKEVRVVLCPASDCSEAGFGQVWISNARNQHLMLDAEDSPVIVYDEDVSPHHVKVTRLAAMTGEILANQATTSNGGSDELVTALTGDPLFAQLMHACKAMVLSLAGQMATLSVEDRQMWLDGVSQTPATFEETVALALGNTSAISELFAAQGFDVQKVYQVYSIADALAQKYNLGGTPPFKLAEMLRAAVDQDQMATHLVDSLQFDASGSAQDPGAETDYGTWSVQEAGIEYTMHTIEDTGEIIPFECIETCEKIYLSRVAVAYSILLSSTIGCAAAGPAAPLCLLGVAAAYITELAAAQMEFDNCLCVCNGGEECGRRECNNDPDCDDDEFCHKGVVGIGINVCKDEKGQGSVCSRHGQCATDCCKYHPATNAVSKTCRPASKCN